MTYATPMARAFRLLTALMLLAVSACAATPPIAGIRTACSALLPANWLAGVAGAEMPAGNTVGDWIAFGDAQTGQLDKANGRTTDAIGIVSRCEDRDAKALIVARKRWWQVWK